MKKTLALILAVALLATMFVMPAVAENDKPYAGTKLTWWLELNSNLTNVTDNLAKTKWYEAVYDATGIEIEFMHPAAGNAAAEFGTLTASAELPDIIEFNWTSYPGGASAAVADEIVISLNDAMDAGKTPNLSKVLADNGEIDRSVRTADGEYYCFPCLRGTSYENNNCLFTSGFYMRGDILKELGLEIPETIQEWDTVLRAVKAAHPDMIPFGTRTEWLNQIFCPGYDNFWDYYVEDGVVKNGLIEDGHYEYLKTMASWYADGLIDPDYLTHTKAGDVRGLMAAGGVFATYDACGGGASAIIPALLQSGDIADESDIVTTMPVCSTKGENAKFSKMNGLYDASTASAAITADCKNVDAALWLLDWFYSDEGRMLNCFGIEGESYNMVDGYPTFTDVILHNETLTVAQALASYCRAQLSGPAIQDIRVNEQYYSYSAQIAGMKIWTKTDYGKYMFPAGAAVATDNADDFATITGNVKTFREESEAKWITGQAELTEETWAAYVAQMKAYGIERAIGYKQAAYDAFMGK